MAEKLRADNAIAIVNDVVLNQFLVRFGADRPDEEADRLTLQTIAKHPARRHLLCRRSEMARPSMHARLGHILAG